MVFFKGAGEKLFEKSSIAKGSRNHKVLSGNYPPILQKKGIGVSYTPTPFFFV